MMRDHEARWRVSSKPRRPGVACAKALKVRRPSAVAANAAVATMANARAMTITKALS